MKTGHLVKLRDEVPLHVRESIWPRLEANKAYRVFHLETQTNGTEVAWVGDATLSPKDVDDFDIDASFDTEPERYKSLFPIAVAHLRRIYD